MADDIVTQVIDCWSDTTIRTHSVGCWEWHPHCAIAILAAEIERLRTAGDALATNYALMLDDRWSAFSDAFLKDWQEARRG